MAKRVKTYNGKYITYPDMQSLGETHDMLVKALPGQSYVLEPMHKVSTTQVTGEALKKVSVGGKGGFGSQGDARDQEKQVLVTSRVMVMADPIQKVFDHNASLEKICVGFNDDGKAIYIKQGESITYKKYVPSHLFGEKEIKGEVEFTKSHGRDYWEFSHSNNLDASDSQQALEFMNEHCKMFGVDINIDIESSRKTYDEICGYKDAWKYVGYAGSEHRRYTITIVNTLNLEIKKTSNTYRPAGGYMNWESSSYNHHVVGPNYELYLESNPGARKDCFQYMMLQLDKSKPEFWPPSNLVDDKQVEAEPSEEFLEMKAKAEELERKRRFEALKKSPDLNDWRMVYNWELTKQGKIMFANEKI